PTDSLLGRLHPIQADEAVRALLGELAQDTHPERIGVAAPVALAPGDPVGSDEPGTGQGLSFCRVEVRGIVRGDAERLPPDLAEGLEEDALGAGGVADQEERAVSAGEGAV